MNKLGRFIRLDRTDRMLLLRAACLLAVARMMLSIVPFRRLSAWLSTAQDCTSAEHDPELPRRIARAIRMAARHVPWRADCFPQTIAARMLLQRHGIPSIIHIGVARGEDMRLTGHAWITCGDTVVTGDTDLDRFAVLHRLPDRNPAGGEPGE